MELKFNMRSTSPRFLFLSCHLLCPNLAETMCTHLEVSLLAVLGRQSHCVQKGSWRVI